MSEKKIISPRKLSGFMELMPDKQLQFDFLKNMIESVFKLHCFCPLDTPVLELSEVLLAKSGGDIDKEIYRFNKGDTDISMRYDLTVPLARFVASNSESLTFPFKRYQIGKVYRGERPQKGRFREFYQCDADIIGAEKLPCAADAECISIINEIFSNKALNYDFTIKISNRNVLAGFIEDLGDQNENSQILIVLDKINKIGVDGVKEELQKLNIDDKNIAKYIEIMQKNGKNVEFLQKMAKLSSNETFLQGINALIEVVTYLENMGLDKKNYVVDFSIIRGQDYYTGTIFETFLNEHPEFGCVCGGGRYDNLATYFTQKKFPGVGLSIGLTRLFDLLDKNNMLKSAINVCDVVIIPLGNTTSECLNLSSKLLKEGIKCEVNYSDKSLKSKLKDASNCRFAIFVGEDEVKSGKFTLKDLTAFEQNTLSYDELLAKIKNML